MSDLFKTAPNNMLYAVSGVPPIEVKGDLKRFDATITSGFTGGGQNEARIPISTMDSFLDVSKSYLYFQVVGATAAFSVDFTAGSFIDRLEIQSNGRTLWRGDRYALYHNIKKAYNSGLDQLIELNNNEGARGLVSQDNAAAYAQHAIHEVGLCGIGEAVAQDNTKNYCLDLECGFLKGDLKKAIPQGANIELVVRFNPNNQAIAAHTGAPTWTINNVRFYSQSYQVLSGEAVNFYDQMRNAGAVRWHGDYLKTYINTLPQASGTHTLQINDRSLSANAMITCLRASGFDGITKLSNSTPSLQPGNNPVTEYEYMIAGAPAVSASPINVTIGANGQDLGRAYEEAIKSLCDNGFSKSRSLVGKSAFTGTINTLGADNENALTMGKGVVAINLKKMDDNNKVFKGVNTASSAAPNNVRITHGALGNDADATTFVVATAEWSLAMNGEVTVVV